MPDVADYWIAFALIAVLCVAGGGLWLVSNGPMTDAQQPRTISSCTTITEPGRYALTADVMDSEVDTYIRIRLDDIVLVGV